MPSHEFTIAVLDGPFDSRALAPVLDRMPASLTDGACSEATGAACRHGTFVVGLLGARRDAPVSGSCPGARLLHVPLFGDATATISVPELSRAIGLAIDAGAWVINLSLAIVRDSLSSDRPLLDALDLALARDVLIVTAAGNQSRFVAGPLLEHPATIPVVATDAKGDLLPISNLAPSIARSGVAALGDNVPGYAPDGSVVRWSGTSVATAVATGIISSIWLTRPQMSAPQIRSALYRLGPRRGLVPPHLTSTTLEKAVATQTVFKSRRTHGSFHQTFLTGAFA